MRERNGSRDKSRGLGWTSASRDGVLSKLGRRLLPPPPPFHSSIVGLFAKPASEMLDLRLDDALSDDLRRSSVGRTGVGFLPRVSFSDS